MEEELLLHFYSFLRFQKAIEPWPFDPNDTARLFNQTDSLNSAFTFFAFQ